MVHFLVINHVAQPKQVGQVKVTHLLMVLLTGLCSCDAARWRCWMLQRMGMMIGLPHQERRDCQKLSRQMLAIGWSINWLKYDSPPFDLISDTNRQRKQVLEARAAHLKPWKADKIHHFLHILHWNHNLACHTCGKS